MTTLRAQLSPTTLTCKLAISASDGGGSYQPLDADLTALSGLATTGIVRRTGAGTATAGTLVTLAELANLATSTMIGRTTAGTGVPEALTATQVRAMLGIPEPVLSTSWSESAAAGLIDVSGLTFTPAASATYLVEVRGVFSAAAANTGFQWAILPGNGTGGGFFSTRGTSNGAQVILIGAVDGTAANGTSSPATPGDECAFWGFAIVTTTGSPTAITVAARSEIAASAVSVGANKARMTYLRLA